MSTHEYFSGDYQEARRKFLTSAEAAKAQVCEHVLPVKAPDGSKLAVDVAKIRSGEQPHLLLIISGTHGVEGFCGSGCQVGFLLDRVYEGLPNTVRVVLIHALNPYGFACLRRVNEDNVDVNRNFHDFTRPPLPSSNDYETIHEWLVPADWDGPARQYADSQIKNYIQEHGLAAFQAAVSGGQYTRSNGLFFGGTGETSSNKILKVILAQLLTERVKHLAVLDLHSGLGPSGYGEPICVGTDLREYLRALKWFGPEVTSTVKGDSTSAPVSGSVADGIHACARTTRCTYMALEFGTLPVMKVLEALRADHWLYAHGTPQSPLRAGIKKAIRDALYVDESWWKAAVYGRFVDMTLRAGRGLHSLGTM
jgi:predicted deacylase